MSTNCIPYCWHHSPIKIKREFCFKMTATVNKNTNITSSLIAYIQTIGTNINDDLTFTTSSSEKGPSYLSLTRSSLDRTLCSQ